MPSLSEIAIQQPHLRPVIDSLPPPYTDQGYSLHLGELNTTLAGDESIIKIPVSSQFTSTHAHFEASAVEALPHDAPLHTPRVLFRGDSGDLGYTVLSRVPGTVIENHELSTLTPHEREEFGKKIGHFIAWLARSVSFESYENITRQSPLTTTDRTELLTPSIVQSEAIGDAFGNTRELLQLVLADLKEKLHDGQATGTLDPSIIGHDDLRDANLTFMPDNGKLILHGVFDFGIMKPSSPERELRHIVNAGHVALEMARRTYELEADASLDDELLMFWATLQAASVCAFNITGKNFASAAEKIHTLHILQPALGWQKAAKELRQETGLSF